jgi:hypothetical protein
MAAVLAAVIAAPVWHYWLGAVLALATVGMVIAIVVGFLRKVESPRYPKEE